MSSDQPFAVVSIDGPSASGKSTVSREVAVALQFTYVDSGALYRGVTWQCLRRGTDVKDREKVLVTMLSMNLEFYHQDRAVGFTIDGEDPGLQLRSEPVRERVSDIAAIPEVRTFIVRHLRDMVRFGNIVMEGRDIGSVVFPSTPFKFYLDADPRERARRRCEEIVRAEGKGSVEEVLDSLTRRDQKDTTRETAPLQIPLGARVVNTTTMGIQEVVALIVDEVRKTGIGR
jgi:CMP/dCMP kinase